MASVVRIHMAGVAPEVQYYACKKCGKVYGARFRDDAPTGV